MSYLNIIAAILDVAGSQPIQPLRRFIFTPPQIPNRDMYLYCAMVNLLFFSRNYMNLILFWYIIAGLLWFPLVFLNVLATILLHFSKKKLSGRSNENNNNSGVIEDCINNFSFNNNNNNSNNISNNFSKESENQGQIVERKVSSSNCVNNSNDNFINQFSDVIQMSSPSPTTKKFPATSLISPNNSSTFSFPYSPNKINFNNNNNNSNNVDGGYKCAATIQKGHHSKIVSKFVFFLKKIKKIVKIFRKRHLIHFFKLLQLICCFLIVYEYGFIYPFLLLIVFPITIIAVHAVITPYDDEASAFFDIAIKKYKIKHLKQLKQQIDDGGGSINNINNSSVTMDNVNEDNKVVFSPNSNASYKINFKGIDNNLTNGGSKKLVRTSKSADSFDEYMNNNKVKEVNHKNITNASSFKLNFVNSNFAFYPSTPVQSFRNINQW